VTVITLDILNIFPMKYTIPLSMKAVMQIEAGGELISKEVPVPKPHKGEVLVKMAASPMNPSDLSFLKGTYVQKPNYPVLPGIEGSGLVVASGGGVLANLRKGKRVTCSSSEGNGGAWAEYMVTSAMRVIPIKKEISMEQGAMLIVNPMTALAFINIAKEGKHKAIVNNAAASVLGRMMIRICIKEGIPLISIVRKAEQVAELKNMGAEFVLNSSKPNFENELKELTHQLNATLLLDAVAGDQTSKLIENSPDGSCEMVYSNMSGEAFSIEPRTLIQGNKSIQNFYLGNWAKTRSLLQTLKAAGQAQSLSGNELGSRIQKKFSIENANDALAFYTENMTGGKVVLELNSSVK
jgi:NADPH:quinone reductase-like Zn-dependent oxidoreductase